MIVVVVPQMYKFARTHHQNVFGTSLVVQWLRLHILNARDLGSVPGQGTTSCLLQLKILHAAIKTQYRQMIFF